MSDCGQPRELYRRVIFDQDRENLRYDTAVDLSKANYSIIQKKYLAQLYNIDPEYAQAVYEKLKFKHGGQEFQFSGVEKLAPEAPTWLREPKSQPTNGTRLTGFAPSAPFYN